MKIIPILFSTPMVQAIMEDRKTQTRREIFKNEPSLNAEKIICTGFTHGKKIAHFQSKNSLTSATGQNPKYQLGDIMWVRETWQYSDDLEQPYVYKQKELYELKPEFFKKMTWKPSIFMPKEACRLFLEVTDVRVERLQNITSKDAEAEGAKDHLKIHELELLKGLEWNIPSPFSEYQFGFLSIWCNINGVKSWESNPWVWVYDFKRVEMPENFLKK